MAQPLVTRRRQMRFKIETTAGTAETSGLVDLHVENARCVPDTTVTEFPATITGGTRGGVGGARSATLSFTVRATTKGSSTAPAWFNLLQACGMISDSGVWKPSLEPPGGAGSFPQKTLTMGMNVDGRWERITGAVGNAVLNGTAGEVLTIDFTFRGRHEIPTAVAIASPTFPTGETPLRVASGGLTIGGYTVVMGAFTLDLGATPFLIPHAGHATGFGHGVVTNHDPNGTLTISAEAISSDVNLQSWKQEGTTKAAVLTIGTGAGKLEIQMDRLLVLNPGEEDRDGNLADAIGFKACVGDTAAEPSIELEWKAS